MKDLLDEKEAYLNLKEVCEVLSISTGTGRNWVRLNKLKPADLEGKGLFFDKKTIEALQCDLLSGKNQSLKSRRNKKFVSGHGLYKSYVSPDCSSLPTISKLLDLTESLKVDLNDEAIRFLTADAAMHLLASKNRLPFQTQTGLLKQFLEGTVSFGSRDVLLDDLIQNKNAAKSFVQNYPFLFELDYGYQKQEDVLGLLYLSCKNLKNRKADGSYYTPTTVVKKLIQQLPLQKKDRILDPCCGTGNFLLQLPDEIEMSSVFGMDIDETGILIARVNMALKYEKADPALIKHHLQTGDFLKTAGEEKYDVIVGNPPWGFQFSKQDIKGLRNQFSCAVGKTIESYDVFLEQAFHHLKMGGRVSFVLPKAVLNVKAHLPIRSFLYRNCQIEMLEDLGNVFDHVTCPSILLQCQKTGQLLDTKGMLVKSKDLEFVIETNRTVHLGQFNFLLNDQEYEILEKLMNTNDAVFLAGQADFALGIVSGNNAEYLSDTRTEENEIILKGSDLRKYTYLPPQRYVVFKPEAFQQCAPVKLYRAKEKLFYRFISNKLIFSYDDQQTVSLNSCNILIPKIENMNIKYILAVLNSSPAQFVFEKQFSSVKVLRSHIESIPIPQADAKTQNEIIALVNQLIENPSHPQGPAIQRKIDSIICSLFRLTSWEVEIMHSSSNWTL